RGPGTPCSTRRGRRSAPRRPPAGSGPRCGAPRPAPRRRPPAPRSARVPGAGAPGPPRTADPPAAPGSGRAPTGRTGGPPRRTSRVEEESIPPGSGREGHPKPLSDRGVTQRHPGHSPPSPAFPQEDRGFPADALSPAPFRSLPLRTASVSDPAGSEPEPGRDGDAPHRAPFPRPRPWTADGVPRPPRARLLEGGAAPTAGRPVAPSTGPAPLTGTGPRAGNGRYRQDQRGRAAAVGVLPRCRPAPAGQGRAGRSEEAAPLPGLRAAPLPRRSRRGGGINAL